MHNNCKNAHKNEIIPTFLYQQASNITQLQQLHYTTKNSYVSYRTSSCSHYYLNLYITKRASQWSWTIPIRREIWLFLIFLTRQKYRKSDSWHIFQSEGAHKIFEKDHFSAQKIFWNCFINVNNISKLSGILDEGKKTKNSIVDVFFMMLVGFKIGDLRDSLVACIKISSLSF